MINVNDVERRQGVAALARLKQTGNDALLTLLKELADEAKSKLVKAGDMVTIHRLQGRAEAFEDLLRAVDDAATVEARRQN